MTGVKLDAFVFRGMCQLGGLEVTNLERTIGDIHLVSGLFVCRLWANQVYGGVAFVVFRVHRRVVIDMAELPGPCCQLADGDVQLSFAEVENVGGRSIATKD